MAKSIIQSFSYGIEQMATVSQAEDLAKKQGKSFSKYLLELIEENLEESKKVEALDRLPILQSQHSRQTTITEYDIKFFIPTKDRLNQIKSLNRQQQTRLAADVIQIQKEIRMVRK